LIENFKPKLLKLLKNIEIPRNKFKSEDEFINYTYESINSLLNRLKFNTLLKKKAKSRKKARELEPDIIIGYNQILLELKYKPRLNDIYRLFYQAVKYPKIAKNSVILYIFDPYKKLNREDINDLERPPQVIVIQRTK
jgi:hypothetical protein